MQKSTFEGFLCLRAKQSASLLLAFCLLMNSTACTSNETQNKISSEMHSMQMKPLFNIADAYLLLCSDEHFKKYYSSCIDQVRAKVGPALDILLRFLISSARVCTSEIS
jgi:hypothetical protein